MAHGLPILLSLALTVAVGLWVYSFLRGRKFEQQASTARRLNESANDAMLVADVVEGRILEANAAAAALLGYGQDELSGMRLPQLHPEALRGKYQDFTQADLTRLREAGYEREFTSLDDGVAAYVRVLKETGGYHREPPGS